MLHVVQLGELPPIIRSRVLLEFFESLPAQALLAPRRLSPDQRYVLKNLVERDGKARSEAIFSLGYWAAFRVSDVSWLTVDNCHIGPKVGWVRVGHKGGKGRDIGLLNEARRPLHEYLRDGGRETEIPYAFASQRSERLTEAGIHHWLRTLKKRATKDEWELVSDVAFHDLRHAMHKDEYPGVVIVGEDAHPF